MNPLSIRLIALAINLGAITAAEAQSAPTNARDFTPDQWRLFTTTGQAIGGVRGDDADDMMLFTCTENPRTLSLTIHPSAEDLSETEYATLAFDGNAPIAVEIPQMNVVGNVLFLLADRDPAFGLVAERFMAAEAVEVAIVQSGAVRSRHKFTLKGTADSVGPVLKLCGQ